MGVEIPFDKYETIEIMGNRGNGRKNGLILRGTKYSRLWRVHAYSKFLANFLEYPLRIRKKFAWSERNREIGIMRARASIRRMTRDYPVFKVRLWRRHSWKIQALRNFFPIPKIIFESPKRIYRISTSKSLPLAISLVIRKSYLQKQKIGNPQFTRAHS